MSLEEKLYNYAQSDFYPFHMPGHKRQNFSFTKKDEALRLFEQIYKMDITEIDGFDNLHHPGGVIKELMDEMRGYYHSEKTYILVNGSTAGILSAISACTNPGDEIAVARNCHKSVLNAAFIRNLNVHYIMPEIIEEYGISGGISPAKVKNVIEKNPNIKVVVIVSPTYEGVVSDVERIAEIVHEYNIPLIVDEAHGAHLSFRKEGGFFPKSALECGADIVIQSLHKTLPAMTQTALLHVNSLRVCKEKIEEYLNIYQTSSPSYILMSSISMCFHYMISEGKKRMEEYESEVISLRQRLKSLEIINLLGKNLIGKYDVFDYDIGKLVINTDPYRKTGKYLADQLREKYHIETEMSSVHYVIAMTSLMDEREGYERLFLALKELEATNNKVCSDESVPCLYENLLNIPEKKYKSAEAALLEGEYKKYEDCLGEISKETLFLYPPGQAFLVAGEVIDENVLKQIKCYKRNGFEISGMSRQGYICVAKR